MPHRLEWWTKLVALLTGIAVGAKLFWFGVVLPSWRRWKDYEMRGEQIDRIITALEDGKVINSFILEKLHIAWFKSDQSGYTIECSGLACSMLEATLEDVVGVNWMSFIADYDKTRVTAEFESCVEHRKTFKILYDSYTATGKLITVKAISKPTDSGWFGTLEIIENHDNKKITSKK